MIAPTLKTKLECSVCDTRIWEPGVTGYKKSAEYNEVIVKLNDLSKMTIGVCSKHKEPTKSDLDKMTLKTLDGWLEEVANGIGNQEWVTNIGSKIKIVGVQ